ncbi:hypothetical protein GCM10009839_84990 [Catenulispora yoronensis]|uniref:Uncharacterized protein n=1 Tax=Catenulispora yoronensis TaxID=450799 RepID=A0ABN2VFR6_9ACTN
MIELEPSDQELIEQILSARCPDATSFLDLDADDIDLITVRLGDVYDVILCVGPAMATLYSRDDLQTAFRTFAAHARIGTQLIIRKPPRVHQAVLEWRARSAWFGFFTSFGELRVFGYGIDMSDHAEDQGF